MIKTKHYYAQYDRTVSRSNPGHGFCNSKAAIAFSSKDKRDAFVASRDHFDMTCFPISRKKAMTMLDIVDPNNNKGLPLDQVGQYENYVILYHSRY